MFKRLARGHRPALRRWREVSAAALDHDRDGVLAELDAFARGLGDDRLMVKPARLGSSLGTTMRTTRRSGRPPSTRRSASTRSPSSSATCRVARAGGLDHRQRLAAIDQYGPGEVIAGREFYDYVAKYTPGMSETRPHRRAGPASGPRPEVRPGRLSGGRGRGFARVDFLVDGDGQIFLSEINTIPGFTPISLFPTLPAAGGPTSPTSANGSSRSRSTGMRAVAPAPHARGPATGRRAMTSASRRR